MTLSAQDYGIIVLIISNLGVWGREYLKHRAWKSKNGQTDQIEKDVKETKDLMAKVNLAMVRVETKVSNQADHCSNTVKAVFSGIKDNANKIYGLAKNGKPIK